MNCWQTSDNSCQQLPTVRANCWQNATTVVTPLPTVRLLQLALRAMVYDCSILLLSLLSYIYYKYINRGKLGGCQYFLTTLPTVQFCPISANSANSSNPEESHA